MPDEGPSVTLREHVEALIQQEKLSRSESERERDRALQLLSAEREKVALAFAKAIEAQLHTAVDGLESQISQTAGQIHARIDALVQHAETVQAALRRELDVKDAAQREADAKTEAALDKRLASLNELRNVVIDRESSYMNKEAAELQFIELRNQVRDLIERLGKIT